MAGKTAPSWLKSFAKKKPKLNNENSADATVAGAAAASARVDVNGNEDMAAEMLEVW